MYVNRKISDAAGNVFRQSFVNMLITLNMKITLIKHVRLLM